MNDIAKIKRNVAKMASMGAPIQDIDGYIASAGSSVEEIRNFKPQMSSPTILNKMAGMASQGVQTLGKLTTTENPIQQAMKLEDKLRGTISNLPISNQAVNAPIQIANDLGLLVPSIAAPALMATGSLAAGALGTRVATTPVGRNFIEKQLPTFGKTLLKETSNLPVTAIQTKEIIKKAYEKITPSGVKRGIKGVEKGVRKYLTKRKPYTEREVTNLALPAEKRLANLEKQAKTKYGEPIDLEKEILKQNLEKISSKEKSVIQTTENILEQRKLKLKQDISKVSDKMKSETDPLKENINIQSQKAAIEGKRRMPKFAKENSDTYGAKLDEIVNIAEQEGKLPSQSVLQDIFDKTDSDIADIFIDKGAPLTRYNSLKEKYLGGLGSEANPEAQALAKALGLKKGQLKGAGIDWSKVDVAQSQFKPPDPNAPINLKELLKDIRSVSKSMSSKAKGAERAFSDDDLVAVIFQKNMGEHMASTYPEFAKLQKAYSPIIEQMKAGRKLFKPGEKYNLGEAPKVLSKPDIMEKQLIGELEKGTKGFNKGLGDISQPISKAQSKLAGTEKGFQIAKADLEKLGEKDIQEIEGLLNIKKEAYKLAKSKVTIQSLAKQKLLEKDLLKRLKTLESRETKVGLIRPREKILSLERKAATGGGIIAVLDYLMRAIIRRSVLR